MRDGIKLTKLKALVHGYVETARWRCWRWFRLRILEFKMFRLQVSMFFLRRKKKYLRRLALIQYGYDPFLNIEKRRLMVGAGPLNGGDDSRKVGDDLVEHGNQSDGGLGNAQGNLKEVPL